MSVSSSASDETETEMTAAVVDLFADVSSDPLREKSPVEKAFDYRVKSHEEGSEVRKAKVGRDLRAETAALAVVDSFGGDVLRGPGGPWVWQHGVWQPGWSPEGGKGGALGDVVAALLGDGYRSADEKTVLEYLVRMTGLPAMHAHPVADGWSEFINFTNGLLHWPTGEFTDHSPDVLSTWQLPVAWNPTAECPEYEKFLSEVLPADMLTVGVDGVAPWQEDDGYMMLAGNPLHVAFLLRGDGRNGKGVRMRVLDALVGQGNTSALSLEDLVDANRKFRLPELVGSALNICGEIDPKYLKSTAAFKGLTGGDPVTIEAKYGKPFRYLVWAVPLFSANSDFTAVDRSVGYFERWQVRSYPNYIPPEERDLGLGTRLVENELEGIAVKAVAGLRVLMARGAFREVESSRVQKEKFRKHSDHVLQFIEDRILFEGVAVGVRRSAIYATYEDWCREEGIKSVLRARDVLDAFRKHVDEKGLEVIEYQAKGVWWVRGIRFPTEESEGGK